MIKALISASIVLIIGCSHIPKDPVKTSMNAQNVNTLQEAEALARERMEILTNLIDPRVDTYTGQEVLPEKCQKEYLPEIISKKDRWGFSKLYSLYSADITMIGSCPNEGMIFKTQYLILYCESEKKIYYVKSLFPEDSPWQFKPVKTCSEL
jgi:hypothetical protein